MRYEVNDLAFGQEIGKFESLAEAEKIAAEKSRNGEVIIWYNSGSGGVKALSKVVVYRNGVADQLDPESTAVADRVSMAEQYAALLPDQRKRLMGVANFVATSVRDFVAMTSAEYNTLEVLRNDPAMRKKQNAKHLPKAPLRPRASLTAQQKSRVT